MPDSTPRETPLAPQHAALGATFTDFGGWLMPVRYTSDLAEHHAVRQAAGLFDISHMAEFTVEGPEAGAYLDYALAGRLSTVAVGKAKYSLILASDGGIIDDVIVYRLSDDRFLVIANAGNRAAANDALKTRATDYDVAVKDVSDDYALIAIQGPQALDILRGFDHVTGYGIALDELPYYACTDATFGGDPALIARTGYTGEDGFELLVPVAHASALWDGLLASGEEAGLVPCGLASRDTLRLEAGMPLYGHELGRHISPAQVGLGRVVVDTKSIFVGKGATTPDADAPVLIGLASEGRRAGRAGYPILDGDDIVGEITSGVLSPTLGHPIAMALVAPTSATSENLTIDIRGTRVAATVTTLPFYRRNA